MRPLRIPALAGAGLAVAGVGWFMLWLAQGRGRYLPAVPVVVDVVLIGLIALVLVLGLRVRAYLKGRRPGLSPLTAARTLGLAQASAVGGVLLSGWYAAQVLVAVGDWAIEPRRAAAVSALVAAILALGLCAAGIVTERWCRLPGGSGDDAVPGQQVEQ